jgi:hypothetical protein
MSLEGTVEGRHDIKWEVMDDESFSRVGVTAWEDSGGEKREKNG